MELLDSLPRIEDTVLRTKIAKALSVLSRTLALYPVESVSLSFNGGKDSTVLLHLLRAALAQSEANNGKDHGLHGIKTFFFENSKDFQEVIDFVHEIDNKYQLHVDYLSNPDFKAGLVGYLSDHKIAAIVLGTRRGDPNAGDQEYFCPSSEGWPPFMRVNPIIDWTYHDVWTFLKHIGVEYCNLYDQGYTSLGSRFNTLPNSALKLADGTFAPAHMLADGRLERAGRQSSSSSSSKDISAQVPSALSASAAIIIIGDEITSGKVQDANTPFLCKELHALGWAVRKVVAIPDDVHVIAAEVSAASSSHDIVITCGGVGPTLDDVTMAGVARALGVPVTRHQGFEERLAAYFGPSLTPAHLKLADLPEGQVELVDVQLEGGATSPFPLVKCNNIFVLPGVPHLVKQKWPAVVVQLAQLVQLSPYHNHVLRLSLADEAAAAPILQQLSEESGAEVAVGSYPVTNQADGSSLLITLESKAQAKVAAAAARMRELLPPGCILSEERDVAELGSSKRRSVEMRRQQQ